jgi:hypothetical protein
VTRCPRPPASRGSEKWLQRAINDKLDVLDTPLRQALKAHHIEWLSPRADDEFSEYRDAAFLDRLGLGALTDDLAAFWPQRGPRWDALARTDRGQVLLIEAKAHIAEMLPGKGSAAESPASIVQITAALDATARALGATPRAPWITTFFQLANRLAHLHFLRDHGIDAWLVLIDFVGDGDMGGPESAEAWQAAHQVAAYVMGLPARHALAPHVIHLYPHVSELA